MTSWAQKRKGRETTRPKEKVGKSINLKKRKEKKAKKKKIAPKGNLSGQKGS